MAHNQTSSDEQNELSRQRRELLAERDTILAQQQAMQTEHDKVQRSCSCSSLILRRFHTSTCILLAHKNCDILNHISL